MGGNHDDLYVDIDATGTVMASPEAQAVLGLAAGRFRLAQDVGSLLVLERVGAGPQVEREVRLAGSFSDALVLPSVLNVIQMSQWDGALQVISDTHRWALFFRRGVYLSGRTSDVSGRLGAILVREGMLAAEQLHELIEQSGSERMGRNLVQRGWMTTTQVYDALRVQAEEIFIAVLRADHGTFRLVVPLDMTEVPAMLRLDVRELLIEGMRRIDEEAHDAELSRARPVASEHLPTDGERQILSTYSEALRRMFSNLDASESEAVREEMGGFLRDSVPYRGLFSGVSLGADGSIDTDLILQNVARLDGEPMMLLQLGLNELLFFGMFAAGDALEHDVERALQRDVALALQALPKSE
jgi:hypothetical protein